MNFKLSVFVEFLKFDSKYDVYLNLTFNIVIQYNINFRNNMKYET
jgi:hypothetical protein